MSKENYETKLSLLKSIPLEEVKRINMPVDSYLQEAEDLYVWAQEDKRALEAVGLNWIIYMEDLPVRAGALRHAQSLWVSERYGREEARKEWDLRSPDAYALREELLNAFRFAFREREDLLSRTQEITAGFGHADMIQDLSDLASLGNKNPQELEKIMFDMEQLTTAETTAATMADLLARANETRTDNSEEKLVRDQAYTHLYNAVAEVRETGRYVFRNKPTRRKGYISNYKKRVRA